MEAQRAHPRARAVVAGAAGVATADGRLRLVPLSEAGTHGTPDPVLLGLDEAGPVFALDEDAAPPPGVRPPMVGAGGRRGEPPPEARGRAGLREAAALLPAPDAGLAGYAAALLNWHRRQRFCGVCGADTELREAGLTRHCPACGTEHHPRTDPVVIMLVEDGDRLLLGRQPTWPERRYSALAGFVAAGESLEEAVVREVAEEAGVRTGPPRYVASQPWPFPGSLMLGFTAPWAGGEVGGADPELEDVRWFERAEVERAVRDEDNPGLLLPPRQAIARRLVEGWLGA